VLALRLLTSREIASVAALLRNDMRGSGDSVASLRAKNVGFTMTFVLFFG
jgi:hypothetical protein